MGKASGIILEATPSGVGRAAMGGRGLPSRFAGRSMLRPYETVAGIALHL
jgi:hypothetical protein